MLLAFTQNLRAGLRLACLLKVRPTSWRASPEQFWLLCILSSAVIITGDFFRVEAPRIFYWGALKDQAFFAISVLILGLLAANTFRQRALRWQLPTLFTAAATWMGIIHQAVNIGVIMRGFPDVHAAYIAHYWVACLWMSAVMWRIVQCSAHQARSLAHGAFALMALLLLAIPPYFIDPNSFWHTDYEQAESDTHTPPSAPRILADDVLARQDELLAQQLLTLKTGDPSRIELYFLGFGSYGGQDVFANEVRFARNLFDQQYGTRQRSVALINHPESVYHTAMATHRNLQKALEALAARMDGDDILILFFTSHGAAEHWLAVELGQIPLRSITPVDISAALRASGIRWTAAIISACYSGGFIDALRAEEHLIATAARADRTSFGCSDDADFTYFGRAFLVEGLSQSNDWQKVFTQATQRIAEREQADNFQPSEPQLAAGKAFLAHWEQWRKQHAATPPPHAPHPPATSP